MLTFNCSCGQMLQVRDEHAGRKIRCPKCQAIATAPQAEAIEPIPAAPVPPASAPTHYTEKPLSFADGSSGREPWDDPDEDRPRRRRRGRDDDDERDRDDRGRTREDERDRPRRRAAPVLSGKAVAGMIFGLATFLIPIFCAIPALILSILGLVDIRRNPARLTGTGLAITGIITGLLGNVSIFGYLGIRSAVRSSGARVELQNNLKQLGLAMHMYHDTYGALPAAGVAGKGSVNPSDTRQNLSWRVALLPFIEQDNLYRQFNFDEPWDGPNNIKLLPLMPKIYAPLGQQPAGPNTTYMQVFTGPSGPFRDNQRMNFARFPDGTSNTILIAEAGEAVPWTKPADMAFDMNGPLPKLGALDSRGFHAVMADASYRFVFRGNDQGLRWAICPDDGNPLPLDWDMGR